MDGYVDRQRVKKGSGSCCLCSHGMGWEQEFLTKTHVGWCVYPFFSTSRWLKGVFCIRAKRFEDHMLVIPSSLSFFRGCEGNRKAEDPLLNVLIRK